MYATSPAAEKAQKQAHPLKALATSALILLTAALLTAAPAKAQAVWFVADPTDTPLNVRESPRGPIIGTLQDGVLVEIIEYTRDGRGNPWVLIRPPGMTQIYGWVYSNYIDCR